MNDGKRRLAIVDAEADDQVLPRRMPCQPGGELAGTRWKKNRRDSRASRPFASSHEPVEIVSPASHELPFVDQHEPSAVEGNGLRSAAKIFGFDRCRL